VERLAGRIGSGEAFTATLAGARIEAGEGVLILRDAGELRRRPAPPLALEPGAAAVWDGRFLVWSDRAGVTVGPLLGRIAALPAAQRRALKALPAAARGALPAFQFGENVTCPILAQASWAGARELVSQRLACACGRFARESDIERGSDSGWPSGALS
jgi:tRNA(Ile)-lysidine synthase